MHLKILSASNGNKECSEMRVLPNPSSKTPKLYTDVDKAYNHYSDLLLLFRTEITGNPE